jgi:N utilization substance protein B
MSKRRDIRRLAMQVLYQIDLSGEADRQQILEGLDAVHDPQDVREAAVELALGAWAQRQGADDATSLLAKDWPTHRQPPVDRAILRLAYHEIISGHAPMKVAINEAVELSKQFSGESSPAFINGVLDKLAKQIPVPPQSRQGDDAWLDDALKPEG